MLDEADEMLSRGFKDQIYDVFQFMPNNLQVISAPMFRHRIAIESFKLM